MSNILTDKSKGKLKESAIQSGLTLLAAVVGGVTGQAIGKVGFLASVPVIFAGEYFEQPYVSALGAGMASSLTAPSSVSGLDGLDGTEKIINLKAAEARVKNYANNLKRAVFLGDVEPQGGNYAYYLSNADLSQDVGRLSKKNEFTNRRQLKREVMSQIANYMEGLGEALAEHDDFLEGHEDVPYSEITYNIKSNLEGIRDAVYSNPTELMGIDEDGEEAFDQETIDTINGIIGMINGASMQGLNGNDEDFIEDLAEEIGALEGLLGLEDDDDDDEDKFLNGDDEDEDEFGNDMLSGSEEFSSELFGLDGEEDDEDIMGGLY